MFTFTAKTRSVQAGFVVACGIASAAHGDIVQDRISALSSLHLATYGQSFTAEGGGLASISTHIIDTNPSFGLFEITVDLYEGTFDTLLDSQTLVLPDMHNPMWTDFDFSGNALSKGAVYSFTVTSTTGRGSVGHFQHTIPFESQLGSDYAGGDMYVDGDVRELHDLAFRVIEVPAPGSMGILASGVMIAIRRRR